MSNKDNIVLSKASQKLWKAFEKLPHNLKLARQAISEGANPNYQDKDGNSILFSALIMGEFSFIMELLKKDLVEIHIKNKFRDTCLHILASANRADVVYERTVSSLKEFDKQQTELADLLITKGISITEKNEDGETAIHIAVRNGNFALVQQLLNKLDLDALTDSIDTKDSYGLTPFQRIEKFNREFLPVIAVLLETKRNESLKEKQAQVLEPPTPTVEPPPRSVIKPTPMRPAKTPVPVDPVPPKPR